VIAGGLIQDKDDVIESLRAGAMGISTSKEEIWFL
jgi:glycerol uptake operon antiterminator